jgi:uncharacterized protein (DUF58 family)
VRYLEPVHLARLRAVRLSFRRFASAGAQTGAHKTRVRGRSQEFTEHREYVPGDELKFLDWKVYARKDRYYIREFHEERNLRAYVLMDGSGSMAFKGDPKRPTKWDFGCHVAAAMSYLILARSDAAGLMTFSDRQLTFLPPRARMQTLEEIDRTLERHVPQGPTRLPEVLRAFAPAVSRRSLLILVSDLMSPEEETITMLKALRARKQEILVLQVLDPVERDMDLEGSILFKDLEGTRELRADVDELRAAYKQAFAHRQRLYESSFRAAGIGHEVLTTDVPWEEALARYLTRLGRIL